MSDAKKKDMLILLLLDEASSNTITVSRNHWSNHLQFC
jgi:hypothetical protein